MIYTRQDHLIVHTFAAESIALFVLFMMWLGGTGNATVRPLFFMPLLRMLTQKCTVHVGKLGVVPTVFAMPATLRARGDCVDGLGHIVIPSWI